MGVLLLALRGSRFGPPSTSQNITAVDTLGTVDFCLLDDTGLLVRGLHVGTLGLAEHVSAALAVLATQAWDATVPFWGRTGGL